MKACKACITPFHIGHKGYCSTDCFFKTLQTRLDKCFRDDTSHTNLLTKLS